jgi:hypothetical protein
MLPLGLDKFVPAGSTLKDPKNKITPPEEYVRYLRENSGYIRGREKAEDRTGTDNIITD